MPRRSSRDFSDRFPAYVPVARQAELAATTVAKLRKKGHVIEPVSIDGPAITTTFWGKAWCGHLESLSDFASRLPRGRTYVRRGSVVHLALEPGRISAKVQGTSLYDIQIEVAKLKAKRWSQVVAECTGSIDSLVELLRGKLSNGVMRVVMSPATGLFPAASELKMSCSCPDWADLCKHLAAVLYGVGARLDVRPELLFTLRGVNPNELVEAPAAAVSGATTDAKRARRVLPSNGLADVFGIDLGPVPAPPPADPPTARAPAKKRSAAPKSPAPSRGPSPPAPGPAAPPPRRPRSRSRP